MNPFNDGPINSPVDPVKLNQTINLSRFPGRFPTVFCKETSTLIWDMPMINCEANREYKWGKRKGTNSASNIPLPPIKTSLRAPYRSNHFPTVRAKSVGKKAKEETRIPISTAEAPSALAKRETTGRVPCNPIEYNVCVIKNR